MRFAELYDDAVERFQANPVLDDHGQANVFIIAATSVAEELVVTVEVAAELVADMILNCPPPGMIDLEPTDWVKLAVDLFSQVAHQHSESDDAVQAEEARRNQIERSLETAKR